jgi:predicted enzyme related to lactoylglutathione lyase
VSRGRFVWYDLMTSDVEGAARFYADIIGWGTVPWEGQRQYMIWTNEDVPLGGLMALPDEARSSGATPHWLCYVAVPDTDSAVDRAVELGGTVLVSPTLIPGSGRFAVLQDPQQAVFAMFTPIERQYRSEGTPAVGEFSWHELAVTDHVAAFEFYCELFGWEKAEAYDMGEMGIYQMYACAGTKAPLGGMFDKPSDMSTGWLLYVRVDDVQRVVEKVLEMGGRVLNGPMAVPGEDIVAQCVDPQGAVFALHSMRG